MRLGAFLSAALAVALMLAAGCDEPQTAQQLSTSYNSVGQTMVFVVDTSGSMNSNDPRAFTPEAAQVALAIANEGDNIGLVSFSNSATAQVPMQKIEGFAERSKLQAAMKDIGKYRSGGTNYSNALNRTREMLAAARATANSNVVFLTDGKPDDQAEDIDQAVVPFIDEHWRINTIGLTLASDNDSMSRMQAQTGGVKKVVVEAKDLLECYLRIALSVNNYWEFSNAPNNSPITLLPGAKRLVYIGIRNKDDRGASLAGVLNAGQSVNLEAKGDQVFRFPPANADWPSNYQVINMLKPEPGVYTPEIQGKVDVFKVMMEPPYDFDFASATPPPVFYGGDPMEIVAVVTSTSPEGLDYFEKMGEVGMSATFDSDGMLIHPYAKFTDWQRQTVDGRTVLVYKHTFQFDSDVLGQKDRQVRLTLVGKVRAGENTEGLWTSERNALVNYRPGDKIHPLAFLPATAKLGDIWADGAAPRLKFELRAIHADQLTYAMTAEPKEAQVTFTPAQGTLQYEQAQDIQVTPNFAAAPTGEQAIKLVATPSALNANLAAETAMVTANVHKLNVKPVQMTNIKPGSLAKSAAPLSIAIEPERRYAIRFEANRPEAQGIFRVVENNGQLWVEGQIPGDAAGDIGGNLVITVPDTTLEARKIPVSVVLAMQNPNFTEVKGLTTEEDRTFLKIAAPNAGVASSTVSFTPKDAAGAELKIALVNLVDRNNHEMFSSSGDVPSLRFSLPSNIDPTQLIDGQPIDLKYSVFVSSDIPADTYQGKLVLQLVRDGKSILVRDIPIEVHVGDR